MLFGNKVTSHQEIVETMQKVSEKLDYLLSRLGKMLEQKPHDPQLKAATEWLGIMFNKIQECLADMKHTNYKGLQHTVSVYY